MMIKKQIYKNFKGDGSDKQRLKNQWANARSIYNFKVEMARLD